MHKVKYLYALELIFFILLYAKLLWFPPSNLAALCIELLFLSYPILISFLQWRRKSGSLDVLLELRRARYFLLAGALLSLMFVAVGILFKKPFPSFNLFFQSIQIPGGLISIVVLYPLFAFYQECVLLSFVLERFKRIFNHRTMIPMVLTLTLFVFSHYPNHVLMIATFLGGIFFLWMYEKSKSIFSVSIVHALLGLSLFYALFPHGGNFTVGATYVEQMKARGVKQAQLVLR